MHSWLNRAAGYLNLCVNTVTSLSTLYHHFAVYVSIA